MSVGFVHTLVHLRSAYDDGTDDEYGQPAQGTAVQTQIQGLVQPRTHSELIDSRSAGSEIGDHVIFLPLMDLEASDAFTYGGDRYEIRGIRRFEFGRLPHLEVDARKVVPAPITAAGS